MKLILHVNEGSDGHLALRAARYLLANPGKDNCAMRYGDEDERIYYARRNKASITAYEP